MGKHDLKPMAPDRGGSKVYPPSRHPRRWTGGNPFTQAVSAGAVGTVGLWPVDPDLLAPLRGDPATAGIFATSTGRCRPSSQTLSWLSRCRGSSRSSKDSPGATGSSRSSRAAQSLLAARLPASILLAGLYGLEVQHHGELQTDPEAERWRPVVSAAATRIRAAAPSGVLGRAERPSRSPCHYRANPALEPQVTALTREVAATARTGRTLRPQIR